MHKDSTAKLFSVIAKNYDFLNRLLSFNLDCAWRRRLVSLSCFRPGDKILDVCTGTGDIAIEFARRGAHDVTGIDLSAGMLARAQQKIEKLNLATKIKLETGSALNLPYGDQTFDLVTIGFGLRNLPDYSRGISEMARVLKPSGRLLILEFSLPPNKLTYGFYSLYLKNYLPLAGRLFSGSAQAYSYLASSIFSFLKPEEVMALMRQMGLRNLSCLNLTAGVITLYSGQK
ncbi:MAG TPA: bifunctional demethylmenaquinone methyltransferase/2-methoxy-6-polyprenyl-1,4-benzoquinol methylase UbiE [Candidatus Saccharicenans sp.]|nr:bifunctional demethylmenaquinone methyltransferase/2-methoxy-6-polyprenyl-1,4-benzoquinol methylase UbiE [Candidatus Saccharicenans sp.]HQM74493.1 bifunctional demethylmenaquinone methyltransferase/2-methoxy-6-polyprenyl-1,4-benzoquinol methylase UbiE [Candidatus Saccharicenans sp.]